MTLKARVIITNDETDELVMEYASVIEPDQFTPSVKGLYSAMRILEEVDPELQAACEKLRQDRKTEEAKKSKPKAKS